VQKLSLEHQWFPSLVRSLLAITGRSENQEFRSKTQALVKVEDPTSFMWIETEYYLQKIQSQVSVYKQVIDNTYGCLPSQSLPRAERSDKDTLILALELVLRISARSPPFKVCLFFLVRCHRRRVSRHDRVPAIPWLHL
jgi:hypothetical protein